MTPLFHEKLEYFGELLTCSQNLYLWIFDPSLQLLESNCPEAEFYQSFFTVGSCYPYLQKYMKQSALSPIMLSDDFGLSWFAAFEILSDQLCRIYMIGPTFTSDMSSSKLKQALDKHSFSPQTEALIINVFNKIPITPLPSWLQYGLMLHYTITGEKIDISSFNYQTNLSEDPSIVSEMSKNADAPRQKTWFSENYALKMIEEGNIDYQSAFNRLSRAGGFHPAGSKTGNLRYYKNSMISFITLATRSAIKGGLDAETAYQIGNRYLESVETSSNISELMQVNQTMFEDFVKRVHKVKLASSVSPAILTCCNYISMHLAEKISLRQLSELTGYDSQYLAQKFKKEMGQTVTEYLKEQRVGMAENLLKHSTLSIAEISDQLGFCNPSYFVETFRKERGCTPNEYRNRK